MYWQLAFYTTYVGSSNSKYKMKKRLANCWGYTFEWTEDHRTPEQLHSLLYTYDELADECLQRLRGISSGHNNAAGDKMLEKDLYSLLRDFSGSDPKLALLWSQVNTIPEWVDWEQISRGQEVFYRYGLPILSAVSKTC